MVDFKIQKQMKVLIDSLSVKYDMFLSNRQYKNVHFKSEDEYITIQKNLSTEIELEEKQVKHILETWFKINFECYKFLAYDSRFICITKEYHRIGRILVNGINNENDIKKIKERFNTDFDLEIIVEDFKDIPDEDKKGLLLNKNC